MFRSWRGLVVAMVVVGAGAGATPAAAVTPVCQDIDAAVTPGTTRSLTLDCRVGLLDMPPSGLKFEIVDPPAHGTLSRVAPFTGTVAYTPVAGYSGDDRFSYRTVSPTASVETAVARIHVTTADLPPVCRSMTLPTDFIVLSSIAACSDPNPGDALEVAIVDPPTIGAATVLPAGKISYHMPNTPGDDAFTVRASAHGVQSAPATIKIAPPVGPPTCADLPPVSVKPSSAVTLPYNLCDAPLFFVFDYRVEVVDPPVHGTVSTPNLAPFLTYTPDEDFLGQDSFTYRRLTPSGSSNLVTQVVEVTAANQPPVCSQAGYPARVRAGQPVAIPAPCTDPEGDAISLDVTRGPRAGALVRRDLGWVYTGDAGGGLDDFRFQASAGGLSAPAQDVFMDVAGDGENLPPQCSPTPLRVTKDVDAYLQIDCTDADGDALTGEVLDAADHGLVSALGSGVFLGQGVNGTYTPDPGFVGTDSVSMAVRDGHGGVIEPIVLPITVAEPTPPPALEPPSCGPAQHLEVRPGSSTSVWLPCAGTVSAAIAPSHGRLMWDTTYAPDPDFRGEEHFTLRVANAAGSDDVDVTVDVTPDANHPPVCYPGPQVTVRAAPTDIALGCSDGDSDPLTHTVTSPPAHGTLSAVSTPATGARSIVYTPDAGYVGLDAFSYRANDGRGDSATVTQAVRVRTATGNARPTCDAYGSSGVIPGTPTSVGVQCRDADGDPLTYAVSSPPLHGTIEPFNATVFTYTANADYAGPDEFSITADDGRSTSLPARVTMNVGQLLPDEPPRCVPFSANVLRDQPRVVGLRCAPVTPWSGQGYVIEVVTPPAHGTLGTLASDGSTEYRPEPGFTGEDSFTYRARKGEQVSELAQVTLVVRAPDAPPGPAPTGPPPPASPPVKRDAGPPAVLAPDVLARVAKTVLDAPVTRLTGVSTGAIAAFVPKGVAVTRAGRRAMALACATGVCRVKVVQVLRSGRRRVSLPTLRATLKPGQSVVVAPKVTAAVKRRLHNPSRATLDLVITVRDEAGKVARDRLSRRLRLR